MRGSPDCLNRVNSANKDITIIKASGAAITGAEKQGKLHTNMHMCGALGR
ncbi:hypothetical protein PCS_01853 [Desulfocurvibacter africanus PCS]|uniref:Uncharacterized protein n=1 Tax=Desulfocurvibacter africanus PCS TaxID=1262666 RepID=M5Q180_DESAF|nr:hypothetical protein PCS_01853 [Desulfocurvibacter africanus PCS]